MPPLDHPAFAVRLGRRSIQAVELRAFVDRVRHGIGLEPLYGHARAELDVAPSHRGGNLGDGNHWHRAMSP